MNRRQFLKHGTLAATAALGGAALNGLTRLLPAAAAGTEPIEVVVLEGSPRERGRMHGKALKRKIGPFLEIWKLYLRFTSGMSPQELIGEFLGATRFTEAIRRWTPGLLDELRGMAEGAGVDYDTLFAFNLPDEFEWYSQGKRPGALAAAAAQCSALGFARGSGRPPVIGQNMDVPSGTEGFEVLLHIKYPGSEREAYLFSLAGMLGLVGLSNAPVGVLNNALRQLNVRPDGLPVNFVVRGLLEQPGYTEAVAFLRQVPHATGHNYLLGGPRAVCCYECSAQKAVEFKPARFPGVVYHTNHPFVNDDRLAGHGSTLEKPAGPTSSQARCAVIERQLAALPDVVTVDTIRSILSSRDNPDLPVCVPHNPIDPGASFTAGCLIVELSEPPVLHLAPGPPCETPFRTYGFT